MVSDERRIAEIVEKVVARLEKEGIAVGRPAPQPAASAPAARPAQQGPQAEIRPSRPSMRPGRSGSMGIFEDIDSAIAAAQAAFERFGRISLDVRSKMIEAMREASRKSLEYLSRATVEETGMGRVEDKIKKTRLAIEKTPGIEDVQPIAFTGDDGLTLVERAPYGVIGSITPSTNATETVICNAIGMVAAGNSVVFNPHPAAKKLSVYYIRLLNEAIMAAGGPENLLCTLAEPTVESAQAMMKHPGIKLLVVTGGPAVVALAMKSGKRVIAAGPGNPPVVVDETAHLEKAAKDIVLGASLDNNIVCVVEKEIIAVSSIADQLKAEILKAAAFEIKGSQIDRLAGIITANNEVVKKFVGKDASVLAKEIGLHVPAETRMLICETDESHPFVQHELLMPVLPFVRVRTVEEAIAMGRRVEHGFRHTAVMHSLNIENLHNMAKAMDCSIFVKNAPSYAGLGLGGEGYTSFTIASPTGEGLTSAKDFTRVRRCVLKDYFRIV